VSTDDLSSPLGQDKARGRRKMPAIPWAPVATVLLAAPVALFAGWAMLTQDPFGGEPLAIAPATIATEVASPQSGPAPTTASPNKQPSAPSVAPPSAPSPGANSKTVTIIDGTNGKRREVVIPSTPDNQPSAPDLRLTEPSRHGPLPKIAQDGTRPVEAFARPVRTAADKTNGPRVALVVGGLGISANNTAEALRKLPGPITFAFAPYGSDIERQAARARDAGHEVLLQIPMEPVDYPDNDPGPHTLLTSLDAAPNLDRLHWLMSRMQGYVGIVNFMGGRFSASEHAMTTLLREIASRGLLYLDDGSSTRSVATQIANITNVPFARADLIIDQLPTPTDLDRALGRLETIARARGTAVGFASPLPVSIDRITRWIKAAESRGIQVVPLSAVAVRTNSS
jgi:uncharacterized protein